MTLRFQIRRENILEFNRQVSLVISRSNTAYRNLFVYFFERADWLPDSNRRYWKGVGDGCL
jgi:hypothetical protein